MYKIAFVKASQKEFMKIDQESRQIIANKIKDLQNGIFTNDKALKGKHKGKLKKWTVLCHQIILN